MTLVVDINHWLDKDGDLSAGPPRLFRQALRIVRFIDLEGGIASAHCHRDEQQAQAPSCNDEEHRRDVLDDFFHIGLMEHSRAVATVAWCRCSWGSPGRAASP
jgi:hypothetical protein